MALLSIPFFTGSMAARPTIKASVDSSQITMGYQTAIRLDIIDNATSPSQVIVDRKKSKSSTGFMATQPTSATAWWK